MGNERKEYGIIVWLSRCLIVKQLQQKKGARRRTPFLSLVISYWL
jgi:hypothetical protein